MDKVLIIGSKGMLGSALADVFADFNPVLWSHDDLDITEKPQVDEKIGALAPNLIINSAAYTNVDGCEENEEIATKVNGTAVGYLANAAHHLNAILVHYSTDYVFDGLKKQGYVEDDKPNPMSAYGRSKLVGEKAIQESELESFYIIRAAWLYGVHGKNFVDTMLSLAKKGKPIKVVDDQIGSPTYALDLAQATLEIIDTKKPFGIYHRANDGQTSWHGFAKEIFSVFKIKANLSACSTEEYPTPTKRPKFSVLLSTKLEPMRSWQDALRDYKETRNI